MNLCNFFRVALLVLFSSCIENDLPYPVVPIDILGVEGEGFTVSDTDINATERSVTLHLDETTDISRVKITDVKITEGGSSYTPLTGTFDLRTPLYVKLSLYQDYLWEIHAEQQIERSFKIAGQVGAAVFDNDLRTVTAQVDMDTDLKNIHVTELKLGPRDITTMDPLPEKLTEFTSVRYVDIAYYDFRERWKLYVTQTEQIVALAEADLWNNTATLSIAKQMGATEVLLEYKRSGQSKWHPTEVTLKNDGSYQASIAPTWSSEQNKAGITVYTVDPLSGVFAGQTYDFRLTVDGKVKSEGTFDTAAGDTIPYGDMEDSGMSCFTQANSNSTSWASGNNTFASYLCDQSSYNGMEGFHCAKLTAGAPVGILAAGNLFTGIFYKDGLTTGVVEFGQPYTWNARPFSLKVKYYAEKIGTVDVDKHDGAPIGAGNKDRARIFVAIVDWSRRHKVTSGTSAPTGTWDPTTGPDAVTEGKVIAYGSLFIDKSSTGKQMLDTELPLYFYDKTVKPTGNYSLVISCSTSAYGDYMVGCKSNVMYVDNFRWGY